MKEYRNNSEENKNFFIHDAYGRIWGNCNVWAYQDKHGRIHMRGRVGNEIKMHNGKSLPLYQMSDIVLTEENILSCETVVKLNGKIISYIELIPGVKVNKQDLQDRIKQKMYKKYTQEISSIYSIEIISNFKLTKSGKRNVVYLEKM